LRGKGKRKVDGDRQFAGRIIVSIPLRGKGKRKAKIRNILNEDLMKKFQSPCGEKVSGKRRNDLPTLSGNGVSIPLRGKGKRKGYEGCQRAKGS